MINLQERNLEELARKERPALPDFDAMWGRIQAKLETPEGASHEYRREPLERRRSLHRRARLLPAAAAISALLAATPVVAGMTMGWPELLGRLGVTTALDNGFGNRLEQTIRSQGVDVTLHGVVTDDNRLDVLFSAAVPDMPKYDYVKFSETSLTDGRGKQHELVSRIRTDESTGRLTGLLETENGLSWGTNKLSLALQNLIFYRYTDNPLPVSLAGLQAGQVVPTGTDYGSLTVTSIERHGETVSLRYEIPVSSQTASHAHPHLFLMVGDRRITSDYAAVLPTDKENVQYSQMNVKVKPEEWEQALLHFSYLEKSLTIDGNWAASLDVDDSKARKAMYQRKLSLPDASEKLSMKLKELKVTPMQIQLLYDEPRLGSNDPQYDYQTMKLQIGDKVIDGGRWHDDVSKWHMRFESPEWYKDWSKVPMKLILSDLVVFKRSTDLWQPLAQVTEQRQSFETTLDGFKVSFDYYWQDDDLIVEARSDDERFLGISQTAVKQDGKTIYPEMEPMPPGGNGSNRRVNKYPGLLAKSGELKLSPGFYSYGEPGTTLEIPLDR